MDEYTSTVKITVFPFSLKRLSPPTLMYPSLVKFGVILIEEWPIKEYSSVIVAVILYVPNWDRELLISPALQTLWENKLFLSFTEFLLI